MAVLAPVLLPGSSAPTIGAVLGNTQGAALLTMQIQTARLGVVARKSSIDCSAW